MQIPVDLLHWSLALLPILVLAFLLVQLRWNGQQAGAVGAFVAAVVALFFFKTPLETLAVAGAKGVWDAIFILLVIWPALLLHEIMYQAGGYEALVKQFEDRIAARAKSQAEALFAAWKGEHLAARPGDANGTGPPGISSPS